MVYYFQEQDIDNTFEFIDSEYTTQESVPNYREDEEGMGRLYSLLDSLQLDYYPKLIDKASRLLIETCLGHYFYNGNKRLAISAYYGFLLFNNQSIKICTNKEYEDSIRREFGDYDFSEENLQDEEPLVGSDFFMYHISILIADHSKHSNSYDDMKNKVKTILEQFVEAL